MKGKKDRVMNRAYAKHAVMLLCTICLQIALGLELNRETVDGVSWSYYLKDGQAILSGGENAPAVRRDIKGLVRIPSVLGGCPVRMIGKFALGGCKDITDIEIPESVLHISVCAFRNCEGLTEIRIPDTVTEIDAGAFYSCVNLTALTWPAGTDIIRPWTFKDCARLVRFQIPDTVRCIKPNAFTSCDGLVSVSIPASVTNLGHQAFSSCRNLARVSISSTNLHLGQAVFTRCTNLRNVVLPVGLTSVPQDMFWGCKRLESVALPAGVTNVREYAFYGCSSLRHVAFPKGTREIGRNTFENCISLRTLEFPETLVSIGDWAFEGCTSLCEVVVSPRNPKFRVHDNLIISRDDACVLLSWGTGRQIRIPPGTSGVAKGAFSNNRTVEEIAIPSSLAAISPGAFSDCVRLTNIVVETGNVHYTSCRGLVYSSAGSVLVCVPDGLREVFVPEGVTCVRSNAISRLSRLRSLRLPRTLKALEDFAISGYELQTVRFDGDAPACGESPFGAGAEDALILIRKNSVGWGEAKSLQYWKGGRVQIFSETADEP